MSAVTSNSPLWTLQEAVAYVQEHIDRNIDEALILAFERERLLPVFGDASKQYLRDDILALCPLLAAVARGEATAFGQAGFFDAGLPSQVRFGQRTWLPLADAVSASNQPAIFPALRQLVRLATAEEESELTSPLTWLGGTCIRAAGSLAEKASEQVRREAEIASVGVADFARTAYYMGTKRDLGPFLVEAMATALPPDAVILDLMCGSGAASGALCRVWPTYASDAQLFCQHLATVQGGGYDPARVSTYLPSLLECAREHEAKLRQPVATLLRREAELCHSDLTEELLREFRAYVAEVPAFPEDRSIDGWSPRREVALRRGDPRRVPYCLFTAYFPSVFLGLRQAIEIDSLRYAIDQLEDEKDRQWALGALVVATSVRATTYAAHFAQPLIRDVSSVSLLQAGKILENWAGSVYHEFAVRLDRLSRQSISARFPIKTVSGPWPVALEQFAALVTDSPVAVYVDAPYTREEYSRYYHVLETLVRYDYPSATGRGKVPSKARAERFASELFTRTQSKMEDGLVQIIRAVLDRGWTCAWSYSTTGSARIPLVVERAAEGRAVRIESFASPHRYMSQRGRRPKDVTEYVLVFSPGHNRSRRGVLPLPL